MVKAGLLTLAATNTFVLAAEAADPLSPYVSILNYGILGIVAFALFRGHVVSRDLYNEMKTDRDTARGELAALRQKIEDVIIPGYTRMTDLATRLLEQDKERR